jgi:hypothetical protein
MIDLTTLFSFLEAHEFYYTLRYTDAKLLVNIGAKSQKWWKAQRVSKVVPMVGVCTSFSNSKGVFMLLG